MAYKGLKWSRRRQNPKDAVHIWGEARADAAGESPENTKSRQ